MTGLSPPGLPPVLLSLGDDILAGVDGPNRDQVEVGCLATTAYSHLSLWNPDRHESLESLTTRADELIPIAEGWLAEIAAHPWVRAVKAGAEQVWIDQMTAPEHSRAPAAERFRPPYGRFDEGARFPSGVPRPAGGGLWTTTALAPSDRDPWCTAVGYLEEEPCWAAPVAEGARVREVRTLGDWQDLIEEHPIAIAKAPLTLSTGVVLPAPLYAPDWEALAAEGAWDAVRFPLDGLMRIAYVAQPVLDGWTVWHEDLGIEQTLWLRWGFAGEFRPWRLSASTAS